MQQSTQTENEPAQLAKFKQLPDLVLQAFYALQQGEAGEREWGIIWKHFCPILDGIAHYYGLQDFDRDDVVQEVFFRVFKNREKLAGVKNFGAWFLTVAYNEMKRFVSQRRRDESLKSLLVKRGEEESVLKQISDPDNGEEISEVEIKNLPRLQQAMACIEKMPPRMRQAYLLCKVQRHRQKEVAAIMQIGVKGVQRQINLAKKSLRKCLATKETKNEKRSD